MFTPSFTPSGEHSLLFRRMEVRTENFTPTQWSENSVLAKQFNVYQTGGYFFLKICPDAFFDKYNVYKKCFEFFKNFALRTL
jgi:hypothetical protein